MATSSRVVRRFSPAWTLATIRSLGPIWLIAFSGCERSGPDIRIGVVAVLDGEGAQVAAAQAGLDGIRLAVEEINGAGGIEVADRRSRLTIVVDTVDDRPAAAATAVLRLVNQERVVAVVGPNFSRSAVPAAESAERLGVPMIAPGAASHRVTAAKRFVFRAVYSDHFVGDALARYLIEQLVANRAAVIYNAADPFGSDVASAFQGGFASRGGTMVSAEPYTSDEGNDFRGRLGRIVAAAPDAVFLPSTEREVVLAQARQARELGLDAHLILGGTWRPEEYAGEDALEGAFLISAWHPDLDHGPSRTFVGAYRAAYGRDPANTAALSYDAIMMFAEAVRTAGGADSEGIREALARPRTFVGVTGEYGFDGTGDPVRGAVVLRIEEGRPVIQSHIEP